MRPIFVVGYLFPMMKRFVSSLHRYPVKGLSAESLDEVRLYPGQGFPSDRRYAITDGSWIFDPANPQPVPKTMFLMLAKFEKLAKLRTEFTDLGDVLVVRQDGSEHRFALQEEAGRSEAVEFFRDFMQGQITGMPQVAHAKGHQFTDVSVHSVALMRSISLINLASLRSLESKLGQPVDLRRFRANVYFDSEQPWQEFDWMERDIRIGETRLKVVRRTRRCTATNVNPVTAEVDLNIPRSLREHFRHGDCGIYCEVIEGGAIRPGDLISTESPSSA